MKRFAWLLFLVVAIIARGQNTNTPNIGLEIPPYGSNNWNIPLNYNFTQLDLLLSGNAALPGLSVTGYASMPGLTTWKSSFQYAIGNVVFYQGTAFTSLVAGNQGNTPVQGSFWSATINGGGGSIPDTTLVLKGNNVGGAVAATLNVDYLSSTYWATLSGCTTAGYSYIPASNNCLLAGGGANTPATMSLLKGGGVANSVLAATAGVDFLAPGAVPATSLLLKGAGIAGTMTPATLNVDYINTSGSITGSAGSLSAASALPNNTTAVTQTTGDTSTNVATDQFVANAVAGGGGGTPGGSVTDVQYNNTTFAGDPTFTFNSSTKTLTQQNNIIGPLGTATSGASFNSGISQWNGSYWTGSAAAADSFQCQDIVTSTSANPFTLLNCYHSGSSGGSEIQWGVNTITQGTMGVVSPGYSFIQTNVQPVYFPETGINYLNNVFYADGFASGTGNYSGIGQATIAYSSSTDAPGCQSVSYSGNYYMALAVPNHTTTPGTNLNIWWPVPQSGATTPLDCAWYMGEAYKHNTHYNALVMMGTGAHYTNGLVDFVDGSSYDDEYAVSLIGCGDKCSYVQYSGAAAIPMINRPTGGANFASMTVRGMTLDGNGVASAAIEVGSIGQSYFENFSAGHVAPGSDHVLEFDHFGGDGFQVFTSNVNIGIYPDTGSQNCGVFTANVVGGSITSYTVNNGGNCYNSTGYGGADLTVVALHGYRGGGFTTPCAVMPTGMTATIVGAAVTAISAGTGGSGCSGTIDVQVYQTENVAYGARLNGSDSTTKDVTSYVGATAAFDTSDAGDSTFIHLHPSVVPNGIVTVGGVHFVGTELDDVGGYGFIIQAPFTQEGLSIEGTNAYIGGNRYLPGSATYYWQNALSLNSPTNIGASGALCTANPGGGIPTDWQEFVTQSGTINTPADYIAKAPHGLSVLGNDTSCSQGMGDYTPGITLGSLTVNALAGNSLTINPSGTATSGANYNSGNTNSVSSYWNGTSAVNCAIGWANQLNSGTNPAGQYSLVTSGCAGSGLVSVNLGYNSLTTSAQITAYAGIYTGATSLNWLGGTFAYSLGTAIASASTIAPTGNGAFHITGSATINTITLPTSCIPSAPWVCVQTFISDGGFATGTSGNIAVAMTTTTGYWYQFAYDNNTAKWYPTGGGSGGGGSGTVNSGTAYSPVYYASTGTAVSGTTPFTGLEYWPGSAAPQAATPSNLLSLVGYYTGAYSSGTIYKLGDYASDGSGNNYISLAAGNVGNALTNATYWRFWGGVSTTITGGNCTSTNQFVTSISTTGVPTCSGLGVALTSATTITSTSFVPTGLALPSIPVSSTVRGRCSIIWEQSTATNTVQFGAGNSSTPTNLYVMNTLHSGASGGTSTDQYTSIATTTTTAISATGAPGATATGYKDEIDFTLVNSATGADVVTIYALTGNASDAVVVEPGSSCEWLP